MSKLEIVVNGEPVEVDPGLTLASWLDGQGRDPRTVAIERNAQIVPRMDFGTTEIAAGDRLEIVQFVQGG